MDVSARTLTTGIFIALALGILTGTLLTSSPHIAADYIRPFGTVFLNLLKFLVVPVVFCSILLGVVSLKDIRKVGSLGAKTLLFYTLTTAGAIALALVLASFFHFPALDTGNSSYIPPPAPPNLMETLIQIFPANIIAPFAEPSMLQIITAALFFGFGILAVGSAGAPILSLLEAVLSVCLRIMEFLLRLSPIGVFCLIAPVIAENGPYILGSLGLVLLCAYIGYTLHAFLIYTLLVKYGGGVSPRTFFQTMAPAIMLGFSSASSTGTLPLNLKCVGQLGVHREVAGFVLPLGATINMDGTAIYQGVCVVFIAACYGVELTFSQLLTIVLTAILASIGTAGVPGAGVLMLAMVLESVQLPVAGIGLVIGIDRLFDMGRTAVNITGDAVCALVVDRLERRKNTTQPQ